MKSKPLAPDPGHPSPQKRPWFRFPCDACRTLQVPSLRAWVDGLCVQDEAHHPAVLQPLFLLKDLINHSRTVHRNESHFF